MAEQVPPEGYEEVRHFSGISLDLGYLGSFDRGDNPGNGLTRDERELLDKLTEPGTVLKYRTCEAPWGEPYIKVYQPTH